MIVEFRGFVPLNPVARCRNGLQPIFTERQGKDRVFARIFVEQNLRRYARFQPVGDAAHILRSDSDDILIGPVGANTRRPLSRQMKTRTAVERDKC